MIRCVVMKPGISRKQEDGSFIDIPVGTEADFTEPTVAWLVPRGDLKIVDEALTPKEPKKATARK